MQGEYVPVELNVWQALLGAFSLSCFFVASLYLWTLLGYAEENRDDHGTIKRRFISTALTCCCAGALIFALAKPAAAGDGGYTRLQLLGLGFDEVCRASFVCLGLTAMLFLGPLVQHLLAVLAGHSAAFNAPGDLWISLRNLVVAPVTEEFVFRACLTRIWVAARIPPTVIIFGGPLFFALAHIHHFLEHLRRSRRDDWRTRAGYVREGHSRPYCDHHVKKACTTILFQVFYTSIFGAYASFLLLRTGSTIAVILAHAFCNHQGFPDVSFSSRTHPLYKSRSLIGTLYLVGLVCCLLLLGPATRGFESAFAPRDAFAS